METLLVALGLVDHVAAFRSRNLTLDGARKLTDAELMALGLNMGARMRLKEALGPGAKKDQ